MNGSNLQWWTLALCVAVPFLLLLGLHLLAKLEAWVEAPEQRAAQVASLMENADETGELEVAVSRLLEEATARRRVARRGAGTVPTVRSVPRRSAADAVSRAE